MININWDRHLVVSIPGMARAQIVDSVLHAATLLAEKWPVTHGPAYQRALSYCARAIEGSGSIHLSRLAFIAAAREAGVEVAEAVS